MLIFSKEKICLTVACFLLKEITYLKIMEKVLDGFYLGGQFLPSEKYSNIHDLETEQ